MQQKAYPFFAGGSPSQSLQSVRPKTEKTASNHLSFMRGGHENHPDNDSETTGRTDRLPHISEQGGMVM
jgi:hypothetical protein